MIRGEPTAVRQASTRFRHSCDKEVCTGEKQAQVPVVEVVLAQRGRAAVMTNSHGVHKAHALQGKSAVAAVAAVDTPTAAAVVTASYEVELGATPPAISSLSVGRPRRFVQMEGTQFLVAHCDDP